MKPAGGGKSIEADDLFDLFLEFAEAVKQAAPKPQPTSKALWANARASTYTPDGSTKIACNGVDGTNAASQPPDSMRPPPPNARQAPTRRPVAHGAGVQRTGPVTD